MSPARALIGATIAFAALALLVAAGATSRLDLATTIALQSVASYPLDVAVNAHTVLGQLVTTLTVATVISVVLWRTVGGWAWVAPFFILATGAVELVFKFALEHPGPPDEFVRAFGNPLGIRVHASSSFPSGHVARLSFLALLVAALVPSVWVRAGAVAFCAATVFARVYIGDHWISDALGGLALGIAAAAAAALWLRRSAARGPMESHASPR